MRNSLQTRVHRWLRAERAGRRDEADRALRHTFELLEVPSPSPGFAAAVMGRLQSVRDPFARLWVRSSIAAGFLLAGVISGRLMNWVSGWGRSAWAGDPSGTLAAAGTGLRDAFFSVLGFWAQLADFAALVASSVNLPILTAVLAVTAVMTLGVFRLVADAAGQTGGARYAKSI